MKNFITEPIPIPEDGYPKIHVRVFEDYDRLDALAGRRDCIAIETQMDKDFKSQKGNWRVGLQNSNLHFGWIATMGDSRVNVLEQVKLLNEKIAECQRQGEKVKVGFCMTGNFSVGYTIYVKGVRCATCGDLKLRENMEIVHKHGTKEHGHCASCCFAERTTERDLEEDVQLATKKAGV